MWDYECVLAFESHRAWILTEVVVLEIALPFLNLQPPLPSSTATSSTSAH